MTVHQERHQYRDIKERDIDESGLRSHLPTTGTHVNLRFATGPARRSRSGSATPDKSGHRRHRDHLPTTRRRRPPSRSDGCCGSRTQAPRPRSPHPPGPAHEIAQRTPAHRGHPKGPPPTRVVEEPGRRWSAGAKWAGLRLLHPASTRRPARRQGLSRRPVLRFVPAGVPPRAEHPTGPRAGWSQPECPPHLLTASQQAWSRLGPRTKQ